MMLVDAKVGYDYELLANNIIPYRTVNRQPPVLEGDAMTRLVESYAPRVRGHHTIKESILLLLAGGPEDPEGARQHKHAAGRRPRRGKVSRC